MIDNDSEDYDEDQVEEDDSLNDDLDYDDDSLGDAEGEDFGYDDDSHGGVNTIIDRNTGKGHK